MLRRHLLAVFVLAASMVSAGAARAADVTVTRWGGQLCGTPYAAAVKKGFFKNRGTAVAGIHAAPGSVSNAVMLRLGRRVVGR